MKKAKDSSRQSGCPIAFTLDILGDKWSLLIIRDMIFLGKRNYGDFLESPEKIASNILASRLKRLEEVEIITKTQDPKNQKKYNYELTPKGIDLIPLLLDVIEWGAKYDPETAAPKDFVKKLKKDKGALLKEIVASLKKGRFMKVASDDD